MRGERERVADRVRDLLGVPAPASSDERRFRWEPSRRSVAAVGLAVLVAIGVSVWWVVSSHPTSVPVTGLSSQASQISPAPPGTVSVALSGAPVPPAPSPTATSPPTIVVDVAGKVVRPGIYRLPPDARVYDAVQAAGGPRAGVDTASINLAAPLQDGEQVVVGVPGAAPLAGAPAQSGAGTSAPAPGDLNTATLEQLETLPGVGPVLGQRILDYRSQHGSFASIDQLNDVSGVGDVTFAELRDLVTV